MDNEPSAEKKARHHARLMRGVVTPILGLLAVASIGLGLMNATEWKPSRTITAQTQVSGSRYVVTDPGVSGLVDDDVKVNVSVGGAEKVCIASTSAKDATGWLSGETYTRLTGLEDWSTLSTVKATGDTSASADAAAEEQTGVDFKDSDMWRAVTCDERNVETEINAKNSSDVLLIDLGKKQNADVSLTWTRKTLPDFAMPFYFVGGLLALGAVLTASVFAMPPHRRRNKRVVSGMAGQLEEQEQQPIEEVSVKDAVAGSLSGLASAFKPRSRRSRRHAAASNDEIAQPTVVDPSARNLVADAAGDTEADDESVGEETSVISADELQAYFARLAQESGESFGMGTQTDAEADSGAGSGADSGTEDAAEDVTEAESTTEDATENAPEETETEAASESADSESDESDDKVTDETESDESAESNESESDESNESDETDASESDESDNNDTDSAESAPSDEESAEEEEA
ncbi:MAG: MSCRAMM family adhesin SdrC [Bifidobacterium merycicum]|uniref:GTPase regulator-like protein n=2 Tax=Bifidobacterium merycicum TaxID=78345 RepID=A0A087BGG6_9BIFI|nr:MSCRAMM family adhesin SdrC [Bifidobacterium merycicum]KFI70116.1 hypothetical protein BMERY_1481 [Bifidobacterium merycicum]MEE3342121.1 MSCRAMM family adhesin SdrC [Bifidobacterium merycicum]SHE80522.1 hypothetical protein SAMN02745589_1806 [Bifidobacterium merycicum DSM 6492]